MGDAMRQIERRLDALEAQGEAHGFTCILRRLVRPGHLDDEATAATVYGRELVRAANEPEEAFIDRARQLAHALKPYGHNLAAFTIE